MVARGMIALVSALVIAWLGVQLRNQAIIDRVSPVLIGDPDLPRGRFEADLDRLADARLLNPDPTWRINSAIALLPRDPGRAAVDAEQAVRDEPDNATAWRVLLGTVTGRDPRRSREARREVLRLDPLSGR
jgi:hypothetical protein